jgi:hypothetical protein
MFGIYLKSVSTLYIRLSLLIGITFSALGALLPGPLPVTELRKQADIVAVATLEAVDESQGIEVVQLRLIRILQGQPGSLSINAIVSPSQTPGLGRAAAPKTGLVPRSVVGLSGVWFLKATANGGWEVVQLDSGTYQQIHTSLPVDNSLEVPSGSVDRQLLVYLVRWYQSLPDPPRIDQDFRLFGSLDQADPQDALFAITPLIGSLRLDHHGIGLATAIRLGSVDALSTVAREAEALRSNPRLSHITDAIGTYFKPQGAAAIVPLQQLAALHSDVPGLDAAVGSALQKIGTKEVLPAMALLLDSRDPQAQLRASWFFGYFAIFADKQGNISGTGMAGPFDSPTVHQRMPRRDSVEAPLQYAQFWKVWWARNRGTFGFPD